jgi:hypothetical protein
MKLILSAAFICLCSLLTLAQAPKSIPFQAVAKSIDGYVLTSQNVSVNFKIRSNSELGLVIFEENQDVITSPVGSFSANIGQGAMVSGSLNPLANDNVNYYLEVNLTIGAQTYPLGTRKLNPVHHAKYANGERFRISEVGDTLYKGGNEGIIIPGISGANN